VLLDNEYEWPAKYTFKFIVPAGKEEEVKDLFQGDFDFNEKSSSGGKYTSTTTYAIMPTAEAIIAIYETASEIEGIISL
jgi:putative lipoic acid-binding regulatory protein